MKSCRSQNPDPDRSGRPDWVNPLMLGAVIHVRPENAKSKKGRTVPIGTTRLQTLLDFLHIDGDQKEKPADAFVFTRGDDEALKSFRTAWELAEEAG